MNIEKIIFSFFIVLAMTLNFGFFLGDIDNPAHHNVYELFAAIVVNLIYTIRLYFTLDLYSIQVGLYDTSCVTGDFVPHLLRYADV